MSAITSIYYTRVNVFERKTLAPGLGCRITIISTFIERILLTVSINVSPFEIEEPEEEKFTTSADNLF